MFTLHALQDDFELNATSDFARGDSVDITTGPFYLTDESGNYLTDESGNRLIAYSTSTVTPQLLRSLPDDFELNAE